MSLTGTSALAVFVAISVASCTKRNPEICCDSAAECTRAGIDGQAHCAEGVCVNFTCVESGCDDDGDCHDANHPICISGQCSATTCSDGVLTTLNGDGTAHVMQPCTFGCAASGDRCNDLAPSNQLSPYLDMTTTAPDLDLGTMATINTTDGTITADGKAVVTTNVEVTQTDGPKLRVFIVHSLKALDVSISGGDAFALVSDGDIQIGGSFLAKGTLGTPGPGVFNDATCRGGKNKIVGESQIAVSGSGGSGFGSVGAMGGTAISPDGTAPGGAGGGVTGTPTLIPLRGGCDGGPYVNGMFGGGGGAIQLVSRATISITGKVGANGAGGYGGASGGGVLLEAAKVDVAGAVTANGSGGASGCVFAIFGEDGRLDDAPAAPGSIACGNSAGTAGGAGAAGNQAAHAGDGDSQSMDSAFAGFGGGGVGRIRVNTPTTADFHRSGLFSPNPTTGTTATR